MPDERSVGALVDHYPSTTTVEIPESFQERWQRLLTIAARAFDVPVALLMRVDLPDIEVVEVSDFHESSYNLAELEALAGRFCEAAVRSGDTVHVQDARRTDDWQHSVDVEDHQLRAYLGEPVEWPTGEVFGTISMLDSAGRSFDGEHYQDLLSQTRDLVETDLELVLERGARQSREAELARRNELLNEFTSVVSHDLRNPLGVAMGHAELAKETNDAAHHEHVLAALRRMERLLEDTLELARQGQTIGETRRVRLRDTAARCWAMMDTDDAALSIDTDVAVVADPDRLRQLFENLFRNSIEHGGEAVTITVGWSDPDMFHVADDGLGIPTDDRDVVFDPGVSNADSGTGFGLSIVKRIADAHGWTVTCTSSDTGGARFEFHGVEKV